MDPKLARAIGKAIEELAELASEDEHNQIKDFRVYNTHKEWIVAAKIEDGKSGYWFKHAIYIDKETYKMEVDGY